MAWPRSNASTYTPGITGPLLAPPLRTLYAVAVAAERARAEPATGYRLYWMASGRFGCCDVPADPEGYVVVGRHSLCDAVIDADPTVALRHMLVRASRLDDGALRLSVIDLHTSLGFLLADGHAARSIVATGPLGMIVGGYALVALPGGESSPADLPPPRVMTGGSPYRDAASIPSITLMPRAAIVGESSASTQTGLSISVTSARGAAVVRVSPQDLDTGVLLGRAPKCNDVLRTVLSEGVSRVHLLLRGELAYDLASTQGTYVAGRRVRSVRIESGVAIQLGTVSPVFVQITAA